MPFNVISPEDVERGLVGGIMPVFKRWGETPLQALGRLKETVPGLAGVPLSYAGRLDPLAEGVMLVLCGEANKERQAYLGLDKEYEFEVLFGLGTDTGDLLGLITGFSAERPVFSENNLFPVLAALKGPQSFAYPAFSSKAVQGKPLFEWFKEGRMNEIQIPTIDVVIHGLELVGVSLVSAADVAEKTSLAASLVMGDFRQEQILASLDDVLIKNSSMNPDASFQVAKIRLACTSGTYVRTLAPRIGAALGVPSLAYSIRRTRVGDLTEGDIVTGR